MFFLDVFTVVGVDVFYLFRSTLLMTGCWREDVTPIIDSMDLIRSNILSLLCIASGWSRGHGGRRGRNVGDVAAVSADVVGFRHGAGKS